jgi:enoyl-CoA hydratase
MTDPLLIEELDDRVVLRLNRPEVRNAIDRATVSRLHAACDDLERRPRVALIVGSAGVFAAGADIAELRERGRGRGGSRTVAADRPALLQSRAGE